MWQLAKEGTGEEVQGQVMILDGALEAVEAGVTCELETLM